MAKQSDLLAKEIKALIEAHRLEGVGHRRTVDAIYRLVSGENLPSEPTAVPVTAQGYQYPSNPKEVD